MGYDFKKWQKRYAYRSDIGTRLTHLTRGRGDKNSIDILLKILNDKKIKGSTNEGFIQGSESAVCFQDAPLYGIAQNLYHEQEYRQDLGDKVRYTPNGLIFSKQLIFDSGGRPVIYEEKVEAAKRFPNELWRVVSYDLSDKNNIVDWTHEREWRKKGNFHFELNQALVLLGNSSNYREFMKKVDKDILDKIKGIIVLDPVFS